MGKFYVVWVGKKPGVFYSREKYKAQTDGFSGALYKKFATKDIANKAFVEGPEKYLKNAPKKIEPKGIVLPKEDLKIIGRPEPESISVDGAWNNHTLDCEYRGVKTGSKELLFKMGPYQDGSNNIAEFLAIVHALAYCKKHKLTIPIYSDSTTAISWMKKKKANTKVLPTERNTKLLKMIDSAETWLNENNLNNKVLKWETQAWGENPADFGRK